jgi:hypothetical protein
MQGGNADVQPYDEERPSRDSMETQRREPVELGFDARRPSASVNTG